ncbi:EexN family lipoprotein [Aggregatibacter actinomycetemcomitans]|uniref:EexN family lipoprotein n=1 Tax=Aggregatibacter actinomycetemcomitans TaxID=714 RepID=UPI00215ADC71|nr:EexN family lipoprotein [Aggregatibacter actinomycetemcomitans]
MKKLSVSLILAGSLLALAGCEEKNMTIYDYLQNEELLNKTLNECISGALNDEHKYQTVKGAYANIDSFKNGSLSEEHLKMLGKK